MNADLQTFKNWFARPIEANSPENDFVRETILMEVEKSIQSYAVKGNQVLIQYKGGVMLAESTTHDGTSTGAPVVFFDVVRNDRWSRVRFWFNKSSVAHLGNFLRQRRDLRNDRQFDAIFVGAAR